MNFKTNVVCDATRARATHDGKIIKFFHNSKESTPHSLYMGLFEIFYFQVFNFLLFHDAFMMFFINTSTED
jgi:hypothetical protein